MARTGFGPNQARNCIGNKAGFRCRFLSIPNPQNPSNSGFLPYRAEVRFFATWRRLAPRAWATSMSHTAVIAARKGPALAGRGKGSCNAQWHVVKLLFVVGALGWRPCGWQGFVPVLGPLLHIRQ